MATLENAGKDTLRSSPEPTAAEGFYFILLNKVLPMLTILNVLTFWANVIFFRGASIRSYFQDKRVCPFFEMQEVFVLFLKCQKKIQGISSRQKFLDFHAWILILLLDFEMHQVALLSPTISTIAVIC